MASIQPSLRDFGNSEFIPALKCRAIVIASLCDGHSEKMRSGVSAERRIFPSLESIRLSTESRYA
jgi:hypothetical protein